MRSTFFVLAGLAAVFATEAQARCNATVNGRPMTWQECEIAREITAATRAVTTSGTRKATGLISTTGRSRVAFIAMLSAVRDPAGPGVARHWSDGPGCVRTEFGSVC